VVQQLVASGTLVESYGAQCVFLDGYYNSDGTPMPLIVQKSDGGYLYATTDLAALQHRRQVEKADRIIYVTDAGQAQHFEMVFKAAQLANMIPNGVKLVHVPFGLVQGEDGKKIKSRAGDSVKLKELLNEAIRIAEENECTRLSANKNNKDNNFDGTTVVVDGDGSDRYITGGSLSEEIQRRARIIGLGAVKYADLSMNRASNYKFSFTKMLSLSGNTAPYMLYAYVRILGIQRKSAEGLLLQQQDHLNANSSSSSSSGDAIIGREIDARSELRLKIDHYDRFHLETTSEVLLAKHLIKFKDVLLELSEDLYPSKVISRHMYIHTLHTYIHTLHTYIHTSIHPIIHTYIHTCIYIYIHT